MRPASFSLIIGILAFVMGMLFLTAPGFLKKINTFSTKMIAKIDEASFSYRNGVGICLLIASVFLFFMAYYFTKRH
ncbi:MAG: hypothetical protein LLF28_00840 [Nitrospiraceae bacterium]|nr:hypothetical protein [Nitrospiraceae bacterium]